MMIEVKNLCKSFTRQVQDEKSKKKKFKIKKWSPSQIFIKQILSHY